MRFDEGCVSACGLIPASKDPGPGARKEDSTQAGPSAEDEAPIASSFQVSNLKNS
jgi:hypothetical protein